MYVAFKNSLFTYIWKMFKFLSYKFCNWLIDISILYVLIILTIYKKLQSANNLCINCI